MTEKLLTGTLSLNTTNDQGLNCLPFSAVWSKSALFAILSNLIFYNVCHFQQSNQGLHCLPFLAVSSGLHCLPFSAGLSGSTLYAILSLISVYAICHSQQSDQGLHFLPFLAVRSRSRSTLSFSAVRSGSTIAILSSLFRVYTVCHSQQSDQGLHCLPFSAVWSGSTLFAILSSLIKVKVYTLILMNILIKEYTVFHSQQSGQGLHYLSFSAVCSRSTLFAILSSQIKVCTICHSKQSDLLQCLPFSAVW